MTGFLINDNVHIVYLDNVIFHRLQRRLSDRNYGCRRRPRYLISANFHVVAKMRLAPGGFQCPSWQTLGLPHCRGPHRIAGPRAPRPHDPPLDVPVEPDCNTITVLLLLFQINNQSINQPTMMDEGIALPAFFPKCTPPASMQRC